MDLATTISRTHGLILDHLPPRVRRTPSGWVSFDCPMCSDTRHRGGVILDANRLSFNCFNCGYRASWTPGHTISQKYRSLALRLGCRDSESKAVQFAHLKHSEALRASDAASEPLRISKFEPIPLPADAENVIDLADDHPVKQYAVGRGILDLYPLYHFHDLANRQRLIIPYTHQGELVGWTGRHVNPPNKRTPKYLHNKPGHGYVFNMDRFLDHDRKIIVLTEGVIDAILLGGAALLSNSVGDRQAEIINRLDKRVILCPDRDRAGCQLVDQALRHGWEVSIPPWHRSCKDAADAVHKYGRLATLMSVVHHATDNTVKVQVQKKLMAAT